MLRSLLPVAGALVQLAECEVAAGDERAHAPRLGKRQGLAKLSPPLRPSNRSECVAMSRQVESVGRKPGLAGRELERSPNQVARLVESAGDQSGPTEHEGAATLPSTA
jgi:hypothetical protein